MAESPCSCSPNGSDGEENAPDAREHLRCLIRAYFKQLTHGCGDLSCRSTDCRSSKFFLQDDIPRSPTVSGMRSAQNEIAAARAVRMAVELGESGLCLELHEQCFGHRSGTSHRIRRSRRRRREGVAVGKAQKERHRVQDVMEPGLAVPLDRGLDRRRSLQIRKKREEAVGPNFRSPVQAMAAMSIVCKWMLNSGTTRELNRLVGSIFSDVGVLCSVFSVPVSFHDEGRLAERARKCSSVFKPQVRNLLSDLFERGGPNWNSPVSSAMEEALKGCLTSIIMFASDKRSHKDDLVDWVYPLRALSILLEYYTLPSLPGGPSGSFRSFVHQFASLPGNTRQMFVQWTLRYNSSELETIVSMLHHHIAMRTFTSLAPNPSGDLFVQDAVRALKIFYESNEQLPRIPFSSFYNDAVSETLSVKEDVVMWLAKERTFSYCNYPFVLNPVVKGKILQLDAHMQMEDGMRESLFRMLLFNRGSSGVSPDSIFFVLRVRRDHLIQDSLEQIERVDRVQLKRELRVVFVDEQAVDEGGVRKEFFQLIVREIFRPDFGMFVPDDESRTVLFNPFSLDHESTFFLVGIVLGLAIFNSIILDLHFPSFVYKKLKGLGPTLKDLEEARPSVALGLRKLLEMNPSEVESVGMTFEVTQEAYGEVHTHNLKPSGESIAVTAENRQEFVDLYVKYVLSEAFEKQFDAFKRGFMFVAAGEALELFRYEELELLVCGSPTLDFHELERNAKYDNGYSANHPVVRRFWSVVHSLTLEQKKKLLFFTTGSDRAPVGGLQDLDFIIVRHGPDSDQLITSHTCFNVLMLPEYSTEERMRDRVLTAIYNAEGFGML